MIAALHLHWVQQQKQQNSDRKEKKKRKKKTFFLSQSKSQKARPRNGGVGSTRLTKTLNRKIFELLLSPHITLFLICRIWKIKIKATKSPIL